MVLPAHGCNGRPDRLCVVGGSYSFRLRESIPPEYVQSDPWHPGICYGGSNSRCGTDGARWEILVPARMEYAGYQRTGTTDRHAPCFVVRDDCLLVEGDTTQVTSSHIVDPFALGVAADHDHRPLACRPVHGGTFQPPILCQFCTLQFARRLSAECFHGRWYCVCRLPEGSESGLHPSGDRDRLPVHRGDRAVVHA